MISLPRPGALAVRSRLKMTSGSPPDLTTLVPEPDDVAVEEPLELRIAGEPIATTMRTPGDDAALAAGFLLAEGIIRSREDLGTITHCGRLGEEGYGNTLDVLPASGAKLPLERFEPSRRGTITTSACGVCGRRTVEDLLERCLPVRSDALIPHVTLASAPLRLQERQVSFARTGGMHAAALLDELGAVLAFAEDVGRHNAVDKVVGRVLLDARLGEARVLAVSGRTSFEIVQKAAMAGVPAIASVSAPSSLAIDLADRTGILLACFVRAGGFSIYTHAERLR